MAPNHSPYIIFFGAPGFPVSEFAFDALMGKGYAVAAYVAKPGEKARIEGKNIPLLQPEKLDSAFIESIRKIQPDLFIVAAYGKIIPKALLEMPPLGVLNIHPSLLPRWRGPSPGQYAILHGDAKTGVSLMKMDEHMDHGPILAQRVWEMPRIRIPSKITSPELYTALGKLGADLLIDALPKWISGEIAPLPQDDAGATYSKILKKDDGRITWSRPAEEIERMIRAFVPWPGAWTLWPSKDKIFRIRVDEADILEKEMPQGVPGFVWQDGNYPFLVKTGKGALAVRRITIEGKKTTDVASFIRGYPEIIGATLV